MPRKPYKFGEQKRSEYLQLLREGQRRGAAAKAVGVTRPTVAAARKDNPDFAAAESQAEMDANELVEDALFQAALSGNVTACQVWLYNRCPERWQDRRNVQMGGSVGLSGRVELEIVEDEEFFAGRTNQASGGNGKCD